MSGLTKAEAEISCGRFHKALDHLAQGRRQRPSPGQLLLGVLTAQALQLIGNNDEATRLARQGLRAADRTHATDASCLHVLALTAFEQGQMKRSLELFQRAQAAAARAGDLEQTGRILLDLLAHSAHTLSGEAIASTTRDCENAIARLGHPHLAARFHIVVAGIHARQGALGEAASHLRAAELALTADPNDWLQGLLALNASTVHILSADPSAALNCARRAIGHAERSGHARTKAGAVANLAHLALWEGKVADAEGHCRNGLGLASEMHDIRTALLETLAVVELIRGRWSECRALLSRIDSELPRERGFLPSWYELAAILTHARLQIQQRDWASGLAICEAGVAVSDERRDRLHGISLRVLGADALLELDRSDEASEWILQAARKARNTPTAVVAEVERARAALLARTGGPAAARPQFERALRVLAAEGGIAVRMDAAGSYLRTMQPANEELRRMLRARPHDLGPLVGPSLPRPDTRRKPPDPQAAGRRPLGFAHAAQLIGLATSADLLAQEAFVLLRESGCAESLALIEKEGDRVRRVLAHEGWTADRAAQARQGRRGAVLIPAGESNGRSVWLAVSPRAGARSRELIHDVETVVDKARLLAAFHTQERATSAEWPPNRTPVLDEGVFACERTARLVALARQVAASDEVVLITGETGTGKEVVARIIHRHSARAKRPFIPFNCAGVPKGMVESQLFGHRRGAFTGAQDDSPGVVRSANGGTLLLDEIGELGLRLQPKLLRFLDRQEVHPLGESHPVDVNVRVIAATNADVEQLVQDGRFREDLYYRLNIIRIDVPPLRERCAEIPALVYHFLRQFGAVRGRPHLKITREALECLRCYAWPGNVRQLANEVRRAVVLADGDGPIGRGLLSPAVVSACRADAPDVAGEDEAHDVRVHTKQPLAQALAEVERVMIRRALAASGGNLGGTARLLGVSRKGLMLKCRRLEIDEIGAPKA